MGVLFVLCFTVRRSGRHIRYGSGCSLASNRSRRDYLQMVDLLRQRRWKSIAGRSEIRVVGASRRNDTADPVHPDGTSARRSFDPDLHVGRAPLRGLPYWFLHWVGPFRQQSGNIQARMDVPLDTDWKTMASAVVEEERDVDPVQPWNWVRPFFVCVS